MLLSKPFHIIRFISELARLIVAMLDFPRLFLTPINKLLSQKRPLLSANAKFSSRNDGYVKLADNGLKRKLPEKRLLSMPIVPFNSPVVTPSSSFMGLMCSRRSISLHTHVRESFPAADAELSRSDSFNISLESEASEEDNDAKAIAALEVTLFQPYKQWDQDLDPDGLTTQGLGIRGLTRKDGSTNFDGLGRVAIKSSTPSPTAQTFDADKLILPPLENPFDHPSDILIQEALVTFMEGHDREQLLQTIAECPWLEEEYGVSTLKSDRFYQYRTASSPSPY